MYSINQIVDTEIFSQYHITGFTVTCLASST